MAKGAAGKIDFLKRRPAAAFLSAMLAGMFIAFGSIVCLSTGGTLAAAGSPAAKLAAGFVFSAALSLVIMAGGDLFTGSNLTIGMGLLCRSLSLIQALAFWAVCWLGNFAGSWLTVAVYEASGLAAAPATADYAAACAAAKLSATLPQMIVKGILCNICVCLAVWCAAKMKSEAGKLVMVVWCILIFMLGGFEHSIANMSILGIVWCSGSGVTAGSYFSSLAAVTLGNVIGGFVFVALPYWYLSKENLPSVSNH